MNRLPDPISQSDFYADVPVKRLLAWLVDGVITFGLAVILSLLTFGLLFFVFFGFWTVISVFYRTISIANRSATPGMRLMGIHFLRSDGTKFDGTTALLHTIGTVICFSTGVQIASILLMLVTPRGQGLVDLVLGTTAINNTSRR